VRKERAGRVRGEVGGRAGLGIRRGRRMREGGENEGWDGEWVRGG